MQTIEQSTEKYFPIARFPPPRTQGPGSERNNIFGCDLEPRKNLRPSRISYTPEVTKRIPRKVAAPDHSPSANRCLYHGHWDAS